MKTLNRKTSFNKLMIAAIISASLLMSQNLKSQSCQTEVKTKQEAANWIQKKMYQAAAEGDLSTLKVLIEEKGVDVNTILQDKQTALLLSSYNGHIENVIYLLEKGADANKTNKWNNAALHDAAMQGNAKIAALLINGGADINIKGEDGFSPLHTACWKNKPMVAKVLLEKGADVSALDNSNRPPIIIASWYDEPEITKLLVEHGADVNTVTDEKNYVLHNIANGGYNKPLEILLEKGANANVEDEMGRLPVHYAVIYRHAETTKKLLEKTKNVNTKETTLGNTPLHIAAINGDKLITEMLINAGAKANIENNANKKPIDYAIKYGYTDLVELYAAKGLVSKAEIKSAKENRKLNELQVNHGDAQVVYCGHSGWIVNTENKVLVFDYWKDGDRNQPSLANGTFNSKEMKDKNVYVFVSHVHEDHYDPIIHTWKEDVKNITYIYGFDANELWENQKEGYKGPEFMHIPDNQQKELWNGMKITTLKSNDTGQGFLVEVDGISIYHPGDLAWFAEEDESVFKKEVDFVADKNKKVDIAFLPVTGCPSRWKKEFIISGFFYSIDKLNPKQVYPMHSFQREYVLKEFAELAEQRKSPTNIVCAENKGDNYLFSKNSMASK